MQGFPTKEQSGNFFLRLHPIHRILISIGVSFIAFLFLRTTQMDSLLKLINVWNVFSLSMLTTSWIVYFTRPVSQIREFARKEDGSLLYVFLVIIGSSFTCLFTVLLLFISKDIEGTDGMYLLAALPAMLFSWAIIHTTFGFHYANRYYDDAEGDPKIHAGGLDFPNEKNPDYLDFAYFSFVIGMTFQVSDVTITSRKIRRLALLHGLISFALNTFVVALTINLIAGLKK
jgi:uncharacterized membrane protein